MAKKETLFKGCIPVDEEYMITMTKGIVIKDEKINIVFSYPLSGDPEILTFKKKGGFTIAKLIQCVQQGYAQIYEAQERGIEDYGIWKHGIADLSIQEIDYDKDKKLITLAIGS